MNAATQARVPKLRFPGFSGDWEESRIDALFAINAGGDVDPVHSSSERSSQFCYPIYANSLQERGLYGFSDVFRQEGGCITLTGRGSLGTPFARDHPFYPIVRLLVLRPKSTSDIWFYEAALSRLRIFVESTGVPQLTGPQIASYRMRTTGHLEQKRIAEFLGAVDGKLAALWEKEAALTRFKRGLMQALFSQTLRFTRDDGSNYPDWEETTITQVSDVETGNSNREDSSLVGDYTFFDRSVDVRRSDNFLYDTEALIVPGEGKDFFPRYFSGKFDLHQRAYAIMNFRGVSAKYLFHWTTYRRHEFVRYSVGSTMPSLRRSTFDAFAVALPHPVEQQKIASALSVMDDKITAVRDQITQLNAFKKGLLQQMFV